MKDPHTFEEMILSDLHFSLLLGLSVVEFLNLNHTEMYAYINSAGIVEEYFLYVHPYNEPTVLSKINVGENNFVRFTYEEMETFLAKTENQE